MIGFVPNRKIWVHLAHRDSRLPKVEYNRAMALSADNHAQAELQVALDGSNPPTQPPADRTELMGHLFHIAREEEFWRRWRVSCDNLADRAGFAT